MPALLFMIGLVGLFFLLMALLVSRSHLGRWMRTGISGASLFLGFMAALLLVGLAREHYIHPPAEFFIEQLQSSATRYERSAVLADLRRQAFNPTLTERAFPLGATPHAIAPADAARSASYLSLTTPRVRPHDLFSEYLDVVFLFDSEGHLITWAYVIDASSL